MMSTQARILLSILCFCMGVTQSVSAAPKRLVYTGDPVKITLGVNEERRLTFPDTKLIWADVKDKLKPKLKTVQIVKNNLYLEAGDSFKTSRIIVGEEGGSRVYLLDVLASHNKVGTQRLVIVEGEDRYAIADKDKIVVPESVIAPLKQTQRTPTAGYKTLFQYAAREIYAPNRLRPKTPGMHREFVNTRPTYHLLRGNEVITQPVTAWRSGGLHVTAIKVNNQTDKYLAMDPRMIRGHWQAALFHHTKLAPKGQTQDSTTLYLISRVAYADAIRSHPMIKIGRR